MPNDGKMDCKFSRDLWEEVSIYFRDINTIDLSNLETKTTLLENGVTEVKQYLD